MHNNLNMLRYDSNKKNTSHEEKDKKLKSKPVPRARLKRQ